MRWFSRLWRGRYRPGLRLTLTRAGMQVCKYAKHQVAHLFARSMRIMHLSGTVLAQAQACRCADVTGSCEQRERRAGDDAHKQQHTHQQHLQTLHV